MQDLQIVRRILDNQGANRISNLLKESTGSYIYDSGCFGSFWHSTISNFVIKAPTDSYFKLKNLNEKEQKSILNAVIELYPHGDRRPEIVSIIFELDREGLTEFISAENFTQEYIEQQVRKAQLRAEQKDYEGAITVAKSLVESVCFHITGEEINDDNLPKLIKKTMKVLNMDVENYKDDSSLQKILSGFTQIIQGLAELRNKFGDAHGKSEIKRTRYKPSMKHALIAVNASKTICVYLMISAKEKDIKTTSPRSQPQ